MPIGQALRQWARRMKRDAMTLWFAHRHPDTPWHTKALALFIVAYALSPIDLIPDFIPVLGYLDDVLLLPGLIWLAIRTLPAPVLAACRQQADAWERDRRARPRSLAGAALVAGAWVVLGALAACWWWRR